MSIQHKKVKKQHWNTTETLLGISDAIASVKDRNELLDVINNKLKILFDFTHSVVLKFSSDDKYLSAFLLDPNSKSRGHANYQEITSGVIPADDRLIQQMINSKRPLVFDLERESRAADAQSYLLMNYRTGLEEFLAVTLKKVNQQPFGILYFYADQKASFSEDTISMIQGLSYHLSTAIVNILYHEEIIQNNRENETLLSISAAISSIRDKRDLLRVINNQLKTVLRFSDLAISIYDLDNDNYKVFLYDCPTMGIHADFGAVAATTHPLKDGIHDRAITADLPVTFSYHELDTMDQPHIRFMLSAGIKELIVVRLQQGNKLIGAMVLMSVHDNSFLDSAQSFILRVSHHIATSVSNIIAYEQIEARDSEKTMLLTFGKDIAAVRNKSGLENVIDQFFPDKFNIRNYIITAKNDDGLTHSYYLFDKSGNYEFTEGFEEIKQAKWSVASTLFDLSYTSYSPIIFDPDRLLKDGVITASYADFWKRTGLERWLGMPLRVGNEDVGVLWTIPGAANDILLGGIASQIGFAINNILANDKIEAQLAEINNYKERLEEQNLYLQEEVQSGFSYSDIVGSGPKMQDVFQLLSQVSFANSTVLILGETGTGKELIARAIHNSSPRKDRLMVKVNCAALPPNLIESELFGHEKGSFTGASDRRIGKFELADKGTLFLDEIGEMPIDLQVKLLRALQEKEIERVGGRGTIKTDVRIIAATNRDLEREVAEGRFRNDLFYRLNVFPITLPPLRERIEDIPVLATHFLQKFTKSTGKKINTIATRAMEDLVNYSWPGNVRELEHLIERSVLMTNGNVIRDLHLPSLSRIKQQDANNESRIKTFEENERDHIIKVLTKCKGKVYGRGGAAEALGLNVATLNSKIKKLKIQKGTTYFKKDL